MKTISLLAFFLTSLLLTNSVFAQYGGWYDTAYIAGLLQIKESYLQGANILWDIIIPFIAIMAICLGFLRTLRIFRNSANIEVIIAFVMAFSTLPSGIFVIIVNFLLGLSGVLAVGAFFLMFILGVALYFWNWGGGTRSAAGLERKLRDAYRKKSELNKELLALQKDPKGNAAQIGIKNGEITEAENYIRVLEAEISGVKSAREKVWEEKST
jgi:hypothetical protein